MALIDQLIQACRSIGANYVLVPVEGRERPIKRERVYCYELYHQLRCIGGGGLTLMGEPDKGGNPSFKNLKKLKPDLILHQPGTHAFNAAVVEVECRAGLEHIVKDLRNFKIMASMGYTELILVLFALHRVPWKRLKIAAAEVAIDLATIKIVHHPAVGQVQQAHPPN